MQYGSGTMGTYQVIPALGLVRALGIMHRHQQLTLSMHSNAKLGCLVFENFGRSDCCNQDWDRKVQQCLLKVEGYRQKGPRRYAIPLNFTFKLSYKRQF